MNTISKSNFNVKIHSGKRKPFEVEVYYTAVNEKAQYINDKLYNIGYMAEIIKGLIENHFNNQK